MDYIENLKNLVCGDGTGQIDTFIRKVMMPEDDASDMDNGTGRLRRWEELRSLEPTYATSSEDNGTTKLVRHGKKGEPDFTNINNNPEYWPNMIDRLNTPFDHIERILLQDLSSVLGIRQEDGVQDINYFTKLIRLYPTLSTQFRCGFNRIDIKDSSTGYQNKTFSGEFFLDSFTYTPFIDYSQVGEGGSETAGVYSDEFLNDYNSGTYNVSDAQVDVHRRDISQKLYGLRNLEKDIYDAKIAFRKAIENTDEKTYIYTFCEHLATLFAKLSNIRMSHEIYGFTPPHSQWEGMLALDIWYQKLYKDIDEDYVFDDNCLDMNPMSRYKVDSDGKIKIGGRGYAQGEQLPDGLEWLETDERGYALVWNVNLWNEYKTNAKGITGNRSSCVTPRGALKKIYDFVHDTDWDSFGNTVCEQDDSGDFPWFKQKGKVYSDSDKSRYSKYVNLHLGRAYEVMPASDFSTFISHESPENKHVKPDFRSVTKEQRRTILERGCQALADAFSVIRNEKLFNIFDSDTNQIEEFQPVNRKNYSQAQCAIVIERIFSRLYRYLNFKSTTGEVIQKHVNIDSGYKYLTTDSLNGSENEESHVYYSPDDEVPHLRYLAKLNTYLDSGMLTADERRVLGQFIEVLKTTPPDWLEKAWNLCPLCGETSAREAVNKLMLRSFAKRAAEDSAEETAEEDTDGEDSNEEDEKDVEQTKVVMFDLKLPDGTTWNPNMDNLPKGFLHENDFQNRPRWIYHSSLASTFRIQLSDINGFFDSQPEYRYGHEDGQVVKYSLMGFSTSADSNDIVWRMNDTITSNDIDSDKGPLLLYAVWSSPIVLRFRSGYGDLDSDAAVMPPIVVESKKTTQLPRCSFVASGDPIKKSTYYPGQIWEPVPDDASAMVSPYGFSHWECRSSGQTMTFGDMEQLYIQGSYNQNPEMVLQAQWEACWNKVTFIVEGEKYCDLLVSRRTNLLEYPEVPPSVNGKIFVGWDKDEGDYLPGMSNPVEIVDQSGETIVCSETVDEPTAQNPQVVCAADIPSYGNEYCVRAMFATASDTFFSVTFRYMSGNDNVEKTRMMRHNSRLPVFHIHQTFPLDSNQMRVFRYWKLEKGNLTSSLTVMGDLEFSAVYDIMDVSPDGEVADIAPTPVMLYPPKEQDPGPTLPACPYYSESAKTCAFTGIPPRQDELDGFSDGNLPSNGGCPFFQLLHLPDEPAFQQSSLMEIGDISLLLKALFKVNLDIAHKEYYLKTCMPDNQGWWYGYQKGELGQIICDPAAETICGTQSQVVCEVGSQLVCDYADQVVCNNDLQVVCGGGFPVLVSFEPSVEFKFSNLHAANQVVNGRLLCTVDDDNPPTDAQIVPVNRELLNDNRAIHYNEYLYCYDYARFLYSVNGRTEQGNWAETILELEDEQRYYKIEPLHLYENSAMQSPTDVNDFVRHRLNPISRSHEQVRTYTTIVKKYRPVIMPDVRDIFNDCVNDNTKYEADVNNDYGFFGWCTIPSKTMVNMEYNEESIIVPSSYDHHNRVGGNNFLQMDSDLENIYKKWIRNNPEDETNKTGHLEDNAKNTWYYLYNTRDWTYFLLPFFNVKQNSELYSYMLDTYDTDHRPENSNHINGVIFEPSNLGRDVDVSFGNVVATCEFLARRHHNENNLTTLAERYTNMMTYKKLKELTSKGDDFNSTYGSAYSELSEDFRFPFQDWVDDYDKTGSFVGLRNGAYDPDSPSSSLKYRYNLGQSHAIDDFDEDSVWFYITMVSPLEDLNQVIELEDIMPFVFWWENRGKENNGPDVDCYGLPSSSKLNYEEGGWCYSGAAERDETEVVDQEVVSNGKITQEHRWHAVQQTLGTDFSKKEHGNAILTTDNSGNVHKGAFDPNCAGSNEKWKVHRVGNQFGTDPHDDPVADKYNFGLEAHGEGDFAECVVPEGMNDTIYESLEDRPMTWNLWNVIRHYAWFKYFKNQHRELGSDKSTWQELENYTKKIVKSIYRTFQQNRYPRTTDSGSSTGKATFHDVDESSTYYGGDCTVYWSNSFVEITTILERNAREHQASFVVFTGDKRPIGADDAYDRYVPNGNNQETCR